MCDSNENDTNGNQSESGGNGENVEILDKATLNLVETDVNLNQIIKQTKQRSWLKCDVCNVPLSSKSSIQRHVQGKRHQINMKKIADRTFGNVQKLYCEICKVKTNGTKQLEDHLKSSKHKGRVEMLEYRKEFKRNCLYGILIGSFIFAIILNIFYAMFLYLQSL